MAPRVAAGFEFGIASDPGRRRKNEPNQDAADLVLPGELDTFPPLLIVADGMGGYRGGEIASQLVVKSIRDQYLSSDASSRDIALLLDCVRRAHASIRQRAGRDRKLARMGTTVVAAILEADHIGLVNVGDSRAYLVSHREIRQLSQDQSVVAEQVRAGALTAEQARGHPKRSRLAMSISAHRPVVMPFSIETLLVADDIVVLCSDGLWSAIPESLIWAAVNELDPQDAADKLVALANASQGPDNISVIVARRTGWERPARNGDADQTNPGE